MALLSLSDLHTAFVVENRLVEAVRGVSFDLDAGETLGLVGESGCGKSVTALSVIRLLPPHGRIIRGSVTLDGVELVTLPQRALRAIRGRRIGIVFQDSMTSLNPLLTIGRQISESMEAHGAVTRRAAERRAVSLLEEVGVPDPKQRLRQYPHQLSGGLRQRVAVAVTLAPNPDVLIADEPTTALDVTIQAQLLELLRREQRERNMGLILITHDLGVVAGMADRIAVMYAGRIVEEGPTEQVFASPSHPYTIGLLEAVPRIDGMLLDRLHSIPGVPPPIGDLPTGCPFNPRCRFALDRCREVDPPFEPVDEAHAVACWANVNAVLRR